MAWAPLLQWPGRCDVVTGLWPGEIEAVHRAVLQPTAQNLLDGTDHGLVVSGRQGEGIAISGGAAGPADTMNIGICGVRDVVVDHVGNPGHIDSSCGDVGGHENLKGAVAKAVQGSLASFLGQISLQGCRLEAGPAQFFAQAFGAVFGAGKYQHRLGVGMTQKLQEHSCLAVLFDRVERVADGVRRGGGADLDRAHRNGLDAGHLECPRPEGRGRAGLGRGDQRRLGQQCQRLRGLRRHPAHAAHLRRKRAQLPEWAARARPSRLRQTARSLP